MSNTQSSSSNQNYITRRRESPPISRRNSIAHPEQHSSSSSSSKRRSSTSNAAASMTVPASINNTKANLAEFAAQITCLFWFESSLLLQRVAESSTTPVPQGLLAPDAMPSLGFRKWVTTILSTTQVSQNVILLALLFIYRLKKSNPSVKGKPGSEFRLLTVALMLGNKFLDDNTYTNKTWAEVSGISVQEIHIMEVEFLSNMRYSLFVSSEDWNGWHTTLGRFWAFWDRAQRAPIEIGSRIPAPITPTLPIVPPSLPSPPPSNSSSPPYSSSTSMPGYSHQLGVPSLMPAHSPITPMPQPDFQALSRKRPYDSAAGMQPPTKRVTRSMGPMLNTSGTQFPLLTPLSTPSQSQQVPRLSINVFPSTSGSQHHNLAPVMSSNQLPLPGTRAMQSVYNHPPISPVSIGPLSHNMNYGSQSRNTSPYSQHNSIHHSAASSPTTPGFSSQQQSPNWILGNRNSPYRPVRGVNTLLVPPPSTSAEPPALCYDQMHYQPLGKPRTEYKTGTVPYMQTETWPQSWPVVYPDYSF
ncbi:hypothetical protein P167DRAFT_551762 [Morchella conica CCBAS932]|uniref:Cyclin-domain-containing protein n=1 Tax=Morchella conica CCBAS932 TaxID=1392247 RepID=A0A3N4KZ79_9PEZI|nr:hypothetical protein P167DRAFT_551762 [Morchella conica CCBAS932]